MFGILAGMYRDYLEEESRVFKGVLQLKQSSALTSLPRAQQNPLRPQKHCAQSPNCTGPWSLHDMLIVLDRQGIEQETATLHPSDLSLGRRVSVWALLSST